SERERSRVRAAGNRGPRCEPPGDERDLGMGAPGGASGGVAAAVRDRADRRDPDRAVSPARRAAAVGAALCLAYLVGAVVSASLGPASRRPILDGLAPPPMYRWVSPPPALASSNQPPSAGRSLIALDAAKGSAATVFSTRDFQASLALGEGAVAPHGQDTQVLLVM